MLAFDSLLSASHFISCTALCIVEQTKFMFVFARVYYNIFLVRNTRRSKRHVPIATLPPILCHLIAVDCGICGGEGCNNFPGGSKNCCINPILNNSPDCADAEGEAPCYLSGTV